MPEITCTVLGMETAFAALIPFAGALVLKKIGADFLSDKRRNWFLIGVLWVNEMGSFATGVAMLLYAARLCGYLL